MIPYDDDVLALLRRGYRPAVRVLARAPAGGDWVEVEAISGCKLTIDAGSQVRHVAELTVAGLEWFPHDVNNAPLSPYGGLLTIDAGVWLPNNETARLGRLATLRTSRVEVNRPDGTVKVTAEDDSARVGRYVFEEAFNPPQVSTLAAIRGILDDVPGIDLTEFTTTPTTAVVDSSLVFDAGTSRWEACEQLADQIGYDIWVTADGKVVARLKTSRDNADAAYVLDTGPLGVISAGVAVLDSADGVNSVTVIGDSAGDRKPVFGQARDTEPSSPTRWGGPYGNVPRVERMDNIRDSGAAQKAAEKLLDRIGGLSWSTDLDCVFLPYAEPDDIVDVRYVSGRIERNIVDRVEHDLVAITTSIETRLVRVVAL